MIIKKLDISDIPSLQKHFYKDAKEEYIRSFIEDQSVYSYIAILNDQVIGFVYGYLLKRINSKPMLYIHSIDVLKEYRGQGVGTSLMNELLELKDKKEVYKIFLITNKSNKHAVSLYTKVGGVTPYEDDIVFEYK